ncbi:MAG TPA: hypothetical protein VK053_04635 [Jiangellaceae bacterium]|nr:hypothetical protein [Jiangellaceae bacterium]
MTAEERRVERWARGGMGGGSFAEVERRVLLESEYAEQPSGYARIRKSGWWVGLQMILGVSPIFGMAAFLSSPDLTGWRRGFDAQTALMVGGICFVLAAIVMVALIVDWVVRGRQRTGSLYLAIFYVSIPAWISLAMINGDNRLDPASGWAMPVWVTAATGVLWVVVSVLLGRPATKDDQLKAPEHPVDINSLPPSEVEALLQIRDQILVTLVEMERFGPGAAERARELPLGELYILDEDESLKEKR